MSTDTIEATEAEATETEQVETPETEAVTETEDQRKAAEKARKMDELEDEIIRQNGRVRSAEAEHDEAKKEASECKKQFEFEQIKLGKLVDELQAVKEGRRVDRPRELPFPEGDEKPVAEDTGGATLLGDVSVEVDGKKTGFTPKQLENLEAKDIKTVANLEELIRTNEWWHRDIPGVGPAAVDKIVDIITTWRALHPVPAEDDEDETEDVAATFDESQHREILESKLREQDGIVLGDDWGTLTAEQKQEAWDWVHVRGVKPVWLMDDDEREMSEVLGENEPESDNGKDIPF